MVDYALRRAEKMDRSLRKELLDRLPVTFTITSYPEHQPQSIATEVYGIGHINAVAQLLDEKGTKYTLSRLSASTATFSIPIPQNPLQELIIYAGNLARRLRKESQTTTLAA